MVFVMDATIGQACESQVTSPNRLFCASHDLTSNIIQGTNLNFELSTSISGLDECLFA